MNIGDMFQTDNCACSLHGPSTYYQGLRADGSVALRNQKQLEVAQQFVPSLDPSDQY